jgi:chromate reductase
MAQPEAYLSNISDDDFDSDGLLKEGRTRQFIETIAHAFHDWVDMIHRSRAALAEDPPRASQQAEEQREHA